MKKTKEQITKKAIELFKSEGYDNVSIERICSECGVTTGSFYYHFQSKRDVIMCYITAYVEDVPDPINNIILEPSRLEQLWILYRDRITHATELGVDILKLFFINNFESQNVGNNELYTSLPDAHRSRSLSLKITEIGQQTGEIRNDKSSAHLNNLFLQVELSCLTGWATQGGNYDLIPEIRAYFETIFMPVRSN